MRIRKSKKFIKNGQSLLIGTLFALMLVSFISYAIYFGTGMQKQMKLQNIADASAYSGAVAQAKILNCISALNEGISFINNLITKLVIVWLALKACAALCLVGIGCACLKPLQIFNKFVKPLLNRLKDLAWGMAKLQDDLMKFGKAWVFYEIFRIARQNDARVAGIYPPNPAGKMNSKLAFAFFLQRANTKRDLSKTPMSKEAVRFAGRDDTLMSCYTKKWGAKEYDEAWGYYFKHGLTQNISWVYGCGSTEKTFEMPRGRRFSEKLPESSYSKTCAFDHAKTVECKKVSEILTKDFKLPNPLVMRDDFGKRQKIMVAVSFNALKDSLSLDGTRRSKTFYAFSQAKPYGDSVFDMDWDARLEKLSLVKEPSSILNLFKNGILSKDNLGGLNSFLKP